MHYIYIYRMSENIGEQKETELKQMGQNVNN